MIWGFFNRENQDWSLYKLSENLKGQVNSCPSSGSRAAVWGAVYSRVQNNFLRTAMRYWHYWHQAEFCHTCLHRPRAQIKSTECQGKSLACSRGWTWLWLFTISADYLIISVNQACRHATLCNWEFVVNPSSSDQVKQEDHRHPIKENLKFFLYLPEHQSLYKHVSLTHYKQEKLTHSSWLCKK